MNEPVSEPLGQVARRVLRGAAVLALAQIASRAIGLIFTLLLAHLLTIEEFGAYNLALSALLIAGILQDLGLSRSVVKEVARTPDRGAEWVGRLTPLKLGLGLVAALLLPPFVWLADFGATTIAVVAVMGLALPALNVWLLLENAAQGMNAIGTLAAAALVSAGLQAGLGSAAALLTDGDLRAVVVSYVVANQLSLAFLWRRMHGLAGPLRLELAPEFWRRALAASLPYLGMALAVAALGRVEALLLGWIAGEAEVARFVAAFKLFEAGLFVVYTAQIAMNPVVARLVVSDRAALGRWFGWETSLAVALLVPAVCCAAFAAAPIVSLLFPPEFSAAAAPLAVLLGTLPVAGVQVFASGVLMLTDRQHAVLRANAVLVGAQIALNLVLIPPLGALGASLALAGAQLVAATVMVVLVARWYLPTPLQALRPLGRALVAQAAALASALALWAAAGWEAGLAVGVAAWAAGLLMARLRLMPPS